MVQTQFPKFILKRSDLVVGLLIGDIAQYLFQPSILLPKVLQAYDLAGAFVCIPLSSTEKTHHDVQALHRHSDHAHHNCSGGVLNRG
jgi:hypothetical protein